jgi:hypothetical protein
MYKLLALFTGSTLYVEKEKWYKNYAYTLNDETDTYARLSSEGMFKTSVKAESADGVRIFKEKGFLSRRLIISDENGAEIARLCRKWTGRKGSLNFSNGKEIPFAHRGFWKPVLIWTDPQRGQLMTVEPKRVFSKKTMLVHIDGSSSTPDLALLALVSIYMIDSIRKAGATAGVSV